MIRRFVIATLACLAAAAPVSFARPDAAPAAAAPAPGPDGVTRFTLDNGLRVLIRPAMNTDEAAIVVLYNFGESADPEGKSGLGHLFEHLYFTAAAGDAPQRTYDEVTNRYMGQMNAQTGEDYTVIATVAPAQSFDEELKDAAARMKSLTIEQSDLDREKPRMYQELTNMYGGIPPLAARNEARSRVRPSPAHARRGGMPDQIASITLDEARARARCYAPGNAIVSIVGGVEPGAAAALVKELFGAIPKGEPSPPRRAFGADIEAQPLVLPLLPESLPATSVNAYNSPAPDSPHYAAALLVVSRLQAKLYQPGVQQQMLMPPLIHPVLDDPHILYLTSPMLPDETPAAAAARLDALVDAACSGEPIPEELQRLRSLVGAFLGLTPTTEEVAGANPYGVAFSQGRREQLGVDAAAINAALDALTEKQLKAFHDEVMAPAKRANVALTLTPKAP